jgi:SAM-dependent methyltransferase
MGDHRVFAAAYARLEPRLEAAGLGELRGRLLASARGRVLEVGAGTGANLDWYPREAVTSIVASEPDGAMRRHLARRLGTWDGPPVAVHSRGLPGLDVDGPFDTIVCTLVLCSVGDVSRGLAELRSLLHPDGRLLFLEHVGVGGLGGSVQRLVTPVWARLAGGCRLDRDTIGTLRAAGFVIANCERPRAWRGAVVVGDALARRAA